MSPARRAQVLSAAVSMLSMVLCVGLVSCAGNKEMDDLAKAQDCLDKVDQSAPEEADKCLTHVEKWDSQQAKILKCSIYMTSGGLVENKIVKAYNALKADSGANKEATYMVVLSLDRPDVDSAYTKAVNADKYCQASGVPGLKFLSGAILIGTTMNKTIKALSGSAVDINDPTAMNAAVQNALNQCTANPPDPSCTTNLSAMGSAVLAMSGSYCESTTADKEVCAQINASANAAGSDPTAVGQALFCTLKGKTFNTSTGECNP
ncbi:MAG: hypothetical protein HC902_10880 [Calothrix sp. SM1_5_4]|nr:hypothetical protein [Calothrix sp. SM1_5_4]